MGGGSNGAGTCHGGAVPTMVPSNDVASPGERNEDMTLLLSLLGIYLKSPNARYITVSGMKRWALPPVR